LIAVIAMLVLAVSIGAAAMAVASPSTTTAPTTTTTTVPPCVIPVDLIIRQVPAAIEVAATAQGSVYQVPVGSVLVVQLAHGDRCTGPQWLAPIVGPSSVVRAVAGSDTTVGATASGTFVVTGVGRGTIRFPGTCGTVATCTEHTDWSVEVDTMPGPSLSTTTTPEQLPHTS